MEHQAVNDERRSRLSAEDWAGAALAALRRGGPSAIAIEPLARTLGATKGSFYWHFRNRQHLVESALALWERRGTDAFIAQAQQGTSPQDRLLHLFDQVLDADRLREGERGLHSSLEDPQVAAALSRVGARRVAYVREQLVAAGLPEQEAARRSHLLYALVLGLDAAGQVRPVRGAYDRAAWTTSILDMALSHRGGPQT